METLGPNLKLLNQNLHVKPSQIDPVHIKILEALLRPVLLKPSVTNGHLKKNVFNLSQTSTLVKYDKNEFLEK